jgi:hypothetical protein
MLRGVLARRPATGGRLCCGGEYSVRVLGDTRRLHSVRDSNFRGVLGIIGPTPLPHATQCGVSEYSGGWGSWLNQEFVFRMRRVRRSGFTGAGAEGRLEALYPSHRG